jgi:hypothetical protein
MVKQYLRDVAFQQIIGWLEHEGKDYLAHANQQATAHYRGRNAIGESLRHTVLHRPRVCPAVSGQNLKEVHVLSIAENGAMLAAFFHSQNITGSADSKLTEHVRRLQAFPASVEKYLVVQGPELWSFLEHMNLPTEVQILAMDSFMLRYADFTWKNTPVQLAA